MAGRMKRVNAGRFVLVSDLLGEAFPKDKAMPDYLAHDCERAEQALLIAVGKSGTTRDEFLAGLLALSHRE